MDGALDEIGFLARSKHRTAVLDELAQAPLGRRELCSRTGASSPTMGRILADLQERRWLEEQDSGYALTPLGRFVVEGFADLRGVMETEAKLRDVWAWLPREMEGFSVDLFADATVSYPGPGYPYQPVERVRQLIEATSSMRGFGTTVFKSVTNEIVCERILEGMDHEYVYSPETLQATAAWDPDRVAEAAACENCTVLVHDDLPDEHRCGIGIFDDRVGICCHDAETGLLEAVIDTDAPRAREWAVSVYKRYRDEATPVTEAETAALFGGEVPA